MARHLPSHTVCTGLSPQRPLLRLYCRFPMTANPLAFLVSSSSRERRALAASTLGWMLDGMDVTLYAMVIRELLRELQLTTAQAGLLASVTLIASAAGGILFGLLADRFGRRLALISSIIVYSAIHRGLRILPAACGNWPRCAWAWVWGWAANGPRARRWYPKPGPMSIAAKRWD